MTKEDYIRIKVQEAIERVSAREVTEATSHVEPLHPVAATALGAAGALGVVGAAAGVKAWSKHREKKRKEREMMKGYAHAAGWNRPQHLPMFSPSAGGHSGPGYGHYGY